MDRMLNLVGIVTFIHYCDLSYLVCRNYEGWTPLHVACKEGRGEVVKTLITDHGAKIDVR